MELKQYFNVLLKWWWLILASVVVAAGSSFLASLSAPRSYLAHTTLMVGQALQNPNANATELYTGSALAQSYSDLVRREPVLRSTLSSLELQWDWGVLQNMVTSRVVPGTQLLEISVLDADPQRAMVLADEIAHQLILQSPASTNPEKDTERQFILSQIEDLKANIKKSQEEVRQLDDLMAQSTSARQIQDARSHQMVLQAQVSSWQATYAQLLSNLQQGSTNFLSIVESARMPGSPVGAGTLSNVLMAAAIGFVLSAAAAFLLEYLDDSIKTSDEIQSSLKIAPLGSITRINVHESQGMLVAATQPRSPEAEAFRILRTNLQFKAVDRSLGTILVTSSSPEEGKSFTASNLAVVFAQNNAHVILVDADLRRPSLHQIFDLPNDRGLTTALLDPQGDIAGLLQPTTVENLKVLTAGPQPPNPSELLGSRRMTEVLSLLLSQADLVLLDSPPVLVASDASVLSTRVDGALLVISARHTRRVLALHAVQALASAGTVLLGAVLNRADAHTNAYSYSYYYSDSDKPRRRTGGSALVLRNVITRFRRSSTSVPTKTDSTYGSGTTKAES
jgi:succinoglycan biosynthesis transport protein ExoP